MKATADEVQFFDYNTNRLAFRRYGNGPTALLAFHGFGQDGRVFAALTASPDSPFTVYALDLFFHGDSRYAGNQLLTKTDWQRLIEAFLQAQEIDRFSLLGFSLGGRFALVTAEGCADRLDQLLLIAPDGITQSIWYNVGTGSATGRWVFRYVLRHLSIVSYGAHALTRLGLLNRMVMRFAEISLGTPEQRRLAYDTWTQFRLIQPDLTLVASVLNTRPITTCFFTGAFDRLVPGQFILSLTRRLRRYELTVLPTGHTHLIELVAARLTQRPLQHLPQTGDGQDNEANDG